MRFGASYAHSYLYPIKSTKTDASVDIKTPICVSASFIAIGFVAKVCLLFKNIIKDSFENTKP
ncbi:hypothetical protein NHP21005_09800 [Helicobacter sp. NHP21005]|nr:hypothetical protein NHP21005_09800 [Helicobacter sp. NHP21005]